MERLSAVVITRNEEKNIGRCIDSLARVADEIVVLDSYSTDNTVAIARNKGAVVKQDVFSGYIEQKNKILEFTGNNFVISLDADEMLSEKLVHSILAEKKNNFKYDAYFMNRYNRYCGKFIKHGLWYPNRKLRLFDKRIARWGGMNPHDKIQLSAGIQPHFLNGDIIHYAYHSVEDHLQRNEEVSSIAAYSLFEAGIKKHWIKIILSPVWSFIHGYFIRLGFLDGYYGFVIAKQTARQSFLKYQKLRQLIKRQRKALKLVINN